ncbi:hypothetical protein M2336_001696 [Sphingobium sp. B1D7B]|uniref:hypothetical protein n=1 Tax=Sphingobium sp. B1D7B TaxID=2940578 RepID=UPI002224A662|nr:hypothetical protein [Sphingobium sp. B1D7B]MCW2405067.1 hypothetical protein [Sphingobium sp. B1D7B]
MRYALLLLPILAAACDDIPRGRSESEIRAIASDEADDALSRAQTRIDALESRLDKLEGDQAQDRKFAVSVYGAHEALRKTFNKNVQADNEQLARNMTARGACGREWKQASNGQWFEANKTCTVKDLKPAN